MPATILLTVVVYHQITIATLVKHKSCQTLVIVLSDSYDAANTAKAITEALGKQPLHKVKTLTWDHHREMTRWKDIEQAVGIKVYFCEPRSS